MKTFLFSMLLCFSFAVDSAGQGVNVDRYLSMIENGQVDQVRSELPGLLSKYPNNPAVLYVQAAATTDGAEAVRLYQNIVDTYPKSEWADAALFKVYKFYYAIGLFRTAELKLDQLKSNYPNSKYLAGVATAEANSSVAENAGTPVNTNVQPAKTDTAVQKSPESVPADQQKSEGMIAQTPKTEVPKAEMPKAVEQKAETAIVGVPQAEAPNTEPPKTESPKVQPPPVSTAQVYSLQVGVFSTRANANKQKSFFEYHHYKADVENRVKAGKELFYVFVGRYASEADAKTAGSQIKSSFNMEYILVTR